jgi:hypothetical protein
MPAPTEATDDISPQLSRQEAIAIMRGGLGEAELELVGSFCAPLYWVTGRAPDRSPVAQNGTAFFMNAGQGVFGVTACHVVHGWMRARRQGAGPLCLATNGNPLVIDWSERVIAAHSGVDIATFRVSEREVAALGKIVLTGYQSDWPPKPPATNCGIYFAGYPQSGTQPMGTQGVSFGLVRGSGVASSVNDRDVVSLFDRSCWLPDPVRGAPPPNFNFGGMSGGIMLTVIQGTLRSWSLSGIVYEGPCTSNAPGEAIDGLEILRARRACFLVPDGQLDVALWHGLGGHDHVEL